MKWREVAPLRYRQVGGNAYVVFGTDENGNPNSWSTDYFNMVSVEQRVEGLRTFGSVKILLAICAAIIVPLTPHPPRRVDRSAQTQTLGSISRATSSSSTSPPESARSPSW